MAELDDGIVSAIANEELKAIASIPAQVANVTSQNFASNQQAMQGIITKSMGNTMAAMDRIGMTEAVAVGGLQSKELGSLIVTLLASLGGGQQATKMAQSTPPETGV